MSTPLSVAQPGLVLAQSLVTTGPYPTITYGGSNPANADVLGMIITTAFDAENVRGLTPALGQVETVDNAEALYSVLGYNYLVGGPGGSTFSLPNLSGAAVVGAVPVSNNFYQAPSPSPDLGSFQGTPGNALLLTQGQLPFSLGGTSEPIPTTQYGQKLQYLINVGGPFPGYGGATQLNALGTIYAFAGDIIPEGYLACNGQSLPVDEFEALYALIGNAYGGTYGDDFSTNTFQLPDLTDAVPIGAGTGYWLGSNLGDQRSVLYPSTVPASPTATSGQEPVSTFQPSLVVNFVIATEGVSTTVDPLAPLLGQVAMYAGNRAPDGWTLCQGQQLSISQYPELYQLIGNKFGGDGVTTFALPDMTGRTIIGSGGSYTIGETVGQAYTYVTTGNLPDITVPILGLSLANDTGASGADHVTSDFSLSILGVWPDAQVQYSADGGKTWAADYQAHPGPNTVWVRQVDILGQVSQTSQGLNFVLDSTTPAAPGISLDYGITAYSLPASRSSLAANAVTSTGSVALSGVEPGSVVSYSTDGGHTWSEHFEAVTGINGVQVRQTDLAGNSSLASGLFVFDYIGSSQGSAITSVQTNPKGGHEVTVVTPGALTGDLGTSSVDTLHYALQHPLSLPSDIENGVLSGTGSGNTFTGNALDNQLEVRAGSWIIDGGAGKDTVNLVGSVVDYILTQNNVGGQLQVTVIGPSGKLVLKNVEAVKFDDLTLSQTNLQSVTDLTQVYDAILGRSPDFTGLGYWQNQLASGDSLSKVIDDFLLSPEFLTRAGQESTRAFVTGLYLDILQRQPDAAGLDYWSKQIDSAHASRGEVVVQILHAAEAVVLVGSSGPVLGVEA